MVLAVDFDDTLHNPHNRQPGYKLGVPMDGAKEALDRLYSAGHKVIVHSVWADTESGQREIAKWMRYFEMPFESVTATKPAAADYFIDDRAITFKSWPQVMGELHV